MSADDDLHQRVATLLADGGGAIALVHPPDGRAPAWADAVAGSTTLVVPPGEPVAADAELDVAVVWPAAPSGTDPAGDAGVRGALTAVRAGGRLLVVLDDPAPHHQVALLRRLFLLTGLAEDVLEVVVVGRGLAELQRGPAPAQPGEPLTWPYERVATRALSPLQASA